MLMASLVLTTSAQAVTFVIGDAFNVDGSESLSDARMTGANGETDGFPNASTNRVFDAATGAITTPFGSTTDPNGFQPLSVGRDFDGNTVRSEVTFNLSALPAPDPGNEYRIVSLALSIELSNFNNSFSNPNNPPNNNNLPVTTDIDVFAQSGSASADIALLTTLPGTPDGSFTIASSASPSQFLPDVVFSNPNSLLDLNNDLLFSITLDAPDSVNSTANFEFITFGSGQGDLEGNEVGSPPVDPSTGFFSGNVSQLAGTNFVNVAPRLIIEVEQVAVPEPSTVAFSLLAFVPLFLRRRR